MLSLMQSLSTELQSVSTGPVVLTWEQMKKLNRITLLRAPFFWAPMSRDQAREMWRDDILTWEDLKNKDTLKQAWKRFDDLAKDEKSYKKQLDKTIDKYAKYLNEKNAVNHSLHIAQWLTVLNERLEHGEYIDHTYALLPNVSPLVLNLCNSKNQKALACWNRIQVMHNWRKIEVMPQSLVVSAWRAWEYYASCWTWYSNIFEKFLVENTKMNQSQARSMVNMWLIAWVLTAWYFLFTKKEWDGRKFAFPSLKKLAWVISIPLIANYASQMTTWNSLLDNLGRLWRTWEFPWSSSESLPTSEQLASQQVMWQFVLLGIPKRDIKRYKLWSFTNWKLTKLNLWDMITYLWTLESQANSSDERTRIWMQRLAIERIKNDNWASIALNNYVASLWITESELDWDGDLSERLSETRAKYQKMLDYISERGLKIDDSRKDKVLDALKEDKVDDKLFDKLKEEWCFIPNSDDERYKEISKLNITNEKKIKLYEAYKKLCDEWSNFGKIELEVENDKIKLTSWAERHKILLNTDLTIDNLTNGSWKEKIRFWSEEELLRTWLFVNYLRSTIWKETPKSEVKDAPFKLSWGLKFWDDLQFEKPTESVTVLSSFVPFFSDMAKNFPTIEKKANREFLRDYLNKLWLDEHPQYKK